MLNGELFSGAGRNSGTINDSFNLFPKAFTLATFDLLYSRPVFFSFKKTNEHEDQPKRKNVAKEWQKIILVVIARGKHFFPFRTERLSPSAPMVLGFPGRVGRCQFF